MNTDTKTPQSLSGYVLVGDGSRKEIECFLWEEIKTDDNSCDWKVTFVSSSSLKIGRKIFFATSREITDPTHGRTTHKKRKLKAEIIEVSGTDRVVRFNVSAEILRDIISI